MWSPGPNASPERCRRRLRVERQGAHLQRRRLAGRKRVLPQFRDAARPNRDLDLGAGRWRFRRLLDSTTMALATWTSAAAVVQCRRNAAHRRRVRHRRQHRARGELGDRRPAPAVASSRSGWTSAAAARTDGSGSHIRAPEMSTPTGADVGDEFVVNSTTLNDQSEPTVTALANGGFAVAWTHVFDGNDTDVFLRIFNANGAAADQRCLHRRRHQHQRRQRVDDCPRGRQSVRHLDRCGQQRAIPIFLSPTSMARSSTASTAAR